MGTLSLTVAHQPGEALHGFLGRTAARNGVDIASFCREMGLDLIEVANGADRAIDRLVELTGADGASLRRCALVKGADRTWTACGQVLDGHMIRRLDARVCPVCLSMDVADHAGPWTQVARCRTAWLVDQIRTCPLHAVELVSLRPVGEGSETARWALHDFVGRLVSSCDGAGVASLPVRHTYVSGLEGYLHGRLSGETTDSWLDRLPFNVVATFTERLGVAALYGPATLFKDLLPSDWKAAGDAGWEIVRRGGEGLREFATTMGRWNGSPRDPDAGCQGSFGKFWAFVLRASRRPDYRPLCLAFASHLGASRPAVPSRLVVEGEDPSRRGYRLSAASSEYRRSPETLRRVLVRHGILGAEHDDLDPRHVFLDRDAVATAMAEFEDRMSLPAAGRHIEATDGQTRLLHRAGLLGEVAGGRRHGVNLTVDRRALDEFLRALAGGAVERERPLAGEVTLLEAARSTRRSLAEVARLVVDGRLETIGRLADVSGFSSVLVRLDEVKSKLNGGSVPGHTVKDVAKILRVAHPGITALIEDGHLSTTTVRQRRTGQAYRVVSRESLGRFRRKYVSVSSVAARWGIHPHAARARLVARGVEPALSAARYATPIFRVRDACDPRAVQDPR